MKRWLVRELAYVDMVPVLKLKVFEGIIQPEWDKLLRGSICLKDLKIDTQSTKVYESLHRGTAKNLFYHLKMNLL